MSLGMTSASIGAFFGAGAFEHASRRPAKGQYADTTAKLIIRRLTACWFRKGVFRQACKNWTYSLKKANLIRQPSADVAVFALK